MTRARKPRFARVLNLLVTGALALLALVLYWQRGSVTSGIDFYAFWVAGQAAPRYETLNLYDRADAEVILAEFEQRALSEGWKGGRDVADWRQTLAQLKSEWLFAMTATPFMYTCFGLLPDRYDLAFTLYRILSAIAAIAAIVLLCVRLRFSLPATLLLLAFFLAMYQPLASDARVMNVNQMQLVAIAGYIWLATSTRTWAIVAGGVVLGLSICFKPNIALIAPLVLWYRIAARDTQTLWPEAAGIGGGVFGAFAASSLSFGSPRCWLDWMEMARGLAKTILPQSFGNVALAVPLAGVLGPNVSVILVAIFTLVAAVAVNLDRGRRATLPVVAGLGPAIYLLSASLVWMHYLVLAIPLALALLAIAPNVWYRGLVLIGLTMLASDPWRILLRFQTTAAEARLFWTGLLILFAVAMWTLLRRNAVRA
jgi:hypothetical protein